MTHNIEWETVEPAPIPMEVVSEDILRDALSASDAIACLLDEAAFTDEVVLLLVNDGHRATRTDAALTALAEVAHGLIASPRFRAIIATGTHRFSAKERAEFEAQTFDECGIKIEEVAWHDVTEDSSLTEIAGVGMHRWVAESRFLLPIGSVEPHYFAGVTGPHKTLTIGCMSREDIERNHAHAMNPAAAPLCLEGNPVHEDVVRILRELQSAGKVICAVAQALRGDAIVAAAAGAPLQTIDVLLPTVRQLYVREVPCPADILRLRVPLPLGRNLYQSDKALKNNHLAVRDRGGIVLEADCFEGIGPDAFLSLLRRAPDWASAKRVVEEEGYHLSDHKAVRLRQLTDPVCRGVHIALVSSHIRTADAESAGMKLFPEVEPALRWLTSVMDGPIERGLIIEDAGVVCTTVRAT
jgi:nickel-dependent lactate racemase